MLAFMLLCSVMLQSVAQRDSLSAKINKIASATRAHIGIAIKDLATNDTLTWNGNHRFPMQSVFKLPLSIYILNEVDAGRLSLDQKIKITSEDYWNTWSPIMKKYPDANIELPLSEVLMYTLTHSDNVGCDVLFKLVGGPSVVEKYFHQLGFTGFAIKYNERRMHAEWAIQFQNWSTPVAMLDLLERVHKRNLLSAASHNFLWQNLVDCPLGPKRMKGLMPVETVVGHRTGTGGPNEEGVIGAVNDVGIVELPNGGKVALVVYLSRSTLKHEELEHVIARVARAVYDHYSR
jgi:beta-lactamase class A